MTRILLSKYASLVARDKVYQTDDALEVESSEHYEVSQRRVFFDDVIQITLHREYGPTYLFITAAISILFLGAAAVIVVPNPEMWPVAITFGVFGVPAFISFLLRAIFGVDVITVFGRRSKAALRFRFRKARAREVYEQLCATVARAQSAQNTELAQP